MKKLLLLPVVFLFSLLQPSPTLAQEDIGISESTSEEPVKKAAKSPVPSPPASVAAKTANADAPPAYADNAGTIIIRTIPDSVTVDINGTRLGQSPWNRKGFLPGFYRVKLDKQGYRPFQKTVQIKGYDTVYIVHDLEAATAPTAASATETVPVDEDLSANASEAPVSFPATAPAPPRQPEGTGTLEVSCSTDSATVVINKVKLGVTPFIRKGFQSGFYEVELKKSGYEPFRKMVKVENDDTTRVEAALLPFFGRLIITSTPENAKVLINEVVSGTTPFDSTGIKPNLYRIRLELHNYVPWLTQRTIEKNRTDTLNVSLVSIAVRDSLNNINARRFKIFRRIFFGTLTAGFAAAGTYYNSRADEQLAVEREAWNAYMEANLNAAEYDTRFATYQEKAEATDMFFKRRNAMYVFGGIFCAGFVLSIPF